MSEPTSSMQYTIVRSPKRRRTIAILIKESRVIVQAPLQTPRAELDEAVAGKAAWITAKLAEDEARTRLATKEYITGEHFKVLGRAYPLVVSEAPAKRIKPAVFHGGCLNVKVPGGLIDSDRAEWVRRSLEKWYRPRAINVMNRLFARWAAETGLKPKIIRVKELKRSWGVCTRENISINWRLVMAPPRLIEYVVVHELCHLRHKNHSPAYYATLASFLPDYKARRKELRDFAVGVRSCNHAPDGGRA